MNETRTSGRARAGARRVERALEQRVEERTRELTALLEVSRSLSSTLALEPLLDLILDQLQRVIAYQGASVMVVRDDTLETVASRTVRETTEVGSQVGFTVSLPRALSIWQAVLRGEPVVIGDVRGDDLFARTWRRVSSTPPDSPIRAWLGLPLSARGEVFGLLALTRDLPDGFSARDIELALAFAGQAAVAIDNARLYERERRTAQELATLLDVSRSAASTLELEPLLNNVLDAIKLVVDYSGASVGAVEGDEFRFLESRGASYAEREPEMIGVRLPMHDRSGIWEPLFRNEPVIIADVRDGSDSAQAFRRTVGEHYDSPAMRYVRSFMDIPLVHRDRLVGLLIMTSREPGVFTERHAGLALAIATHIAAALENARLYGEAQGKAALEERQKLARELHDSVSQALFGIALGATAARRRLDMDPARLGESLDYVLTLADAALTEMRALIFELRPEALEKEGLVAALSRHAAAMQARHEIAVETAFCEEPDVPLAAKEALYRIAQEAMHNTVKHARATRISLVLAHSPDGLVLEVRDDGIGFDATGSFPGHLGLVSMRERVAHLGGAVDVESAPGCGTVVRAAISVGASPRR